MENQENGANNNYVFVSWYILNEDRYYNCFLIKDIYCGKLAKAKIFNVMHT